VFEKVDKLSKYFTNLIDNTKNDLNKSIKMKDRVITELKFKITTLNNDLDLTNETILKLREQKSDLNKE
jgi:hypothetical protein